jgi:hypothetical protein
MRNAIAEALGGEEEEVVEPPPGEVEPPARPQPTIRLDVEVIGDVTIIINGVPVT